MFLSTVVAIVCFFLAARLVYNWSKLYKIPGPFLASITDLWRAYHQYRGQLRGKLLDLHKKHGSFVRYGVNCVSISDPAAISIIYGSRAGFKTADSYTVLRGIKDGKNIESLVSTPDEAKHSALRRSVAKAFTPTSVLDYEPVIDEAIPELIQALSEQQVVNICQTLTFATIDTAMRVSFSESLGFLKSRSDVGGLIQMIRNHFYHWGWWSSIPGLERLIFRNPIAMRQSRPALGLVAVAVRQIQARTSSSPLEKSEQKLDLLHNFMQASHEHPEALSPAGIIGMLSSTIAGAGDTTATTMTAIIYYLLRNPACLTTLQNELDHAYLSETPSYAQVQHLPYLSAVIRESMRLFTLITFPLERVVPSPGATICGAFFPTGTTVGCMPQAIHLNSAAFGSDAAVFRPERWLGASGEKLREMEAAHLGFSRGRRVCLGQNIAVLQMKKIVAAVVGKFDMKLVYPEKELEADYSPTVVLLKPLFVHIEKRGGAA